MAAKACAWLAMAAKACAWLAMAAKAWLFEAKFAKAPALADDRVAKASELLRVAAADWADIAPAIEARAWNCCRLPASAWNCWAFDDIAARAAPFWASALKAGSRAMARKDGSLTISWKASVCINCGTLESPSWTSASVTWAER